MHSPPATLVRQYFPTERLKPYIKYFVISEREPAGEYKVLPSLGPVIGLQYSGHLSTLMNDVKTRLNSAEVTGLSDGYRIFSSSENIGTILIYFSATGFVHFARNPVNELFNLSLSLEDVFPSARVREIGEKLHFAVSDEQRINVVEQFLISQINDEPSDKVITEATRLIIKTRGTTRMERLAKSLYISQSPFEKRFKKIVGTAPKKFASIVRFNYIIGSLNSEKLLIELSCESDFYDQAHFSKGFKQYTGETPEEFKSALLKRPFFSTVETSDRMHSRSDFRVKAVENLYQSGRV